MVSFKESRAYYGAPLIFVLPYHGEYQDDFSRSEVVRLVRQKWTVQSTVWCSRSGKSSTRRLHSWNKLSSFLMARGFWLGLGHVSVTIEWGGCKAAVDVGMTRFVDKCDVGSTIGTVDSAKIIDDG